MAEDTPFIGIDFGTSKCAVAWLNPATGQAEVLRSAEGEDKTPSVVYFGERETLVGKPAVEMLQDPAQRKRVVAGIKRELARPLRIPVAGRRLSPVEIAAEIFRKLKRDAEEGHFHAPVVRAIVTCPAAFDQLERDRIAEAAKRAGFEEAVLLDEPVAAALAYARAGFQVGKHVLVYDFGAGTFDLALVAYDGASDSFRLALEPWGIRSGGDNFDLALYDHCDDAARELLGRPVSPDGTMDLQFLRECRRWKELLSSQDRCDLSAWIRDPEQGALEFRHALDRETFETLILPYVRPTVTLTGRFLADSRAQGCPAESVVLIGGSSRVPLIGRMLAESLPVEPQRWQLQDVAVALGAACWAARLWGRREAAAAGDAAAYRKEVEAVGPRGDWSGEAVERLRARARELGLGPGEAVAVEREALGAAAEGMQARQDAAGREFRAALRMAGADRSLNAPETQQLAALAEELGLAPERVEALRREVLVGATVSDGPAAAEPDAAARELYATAEALLRGGDLDGALQHAQAAADLAPRWAAAFHMKADLLDRKGQPRPAAAAATACLRVDPDFRPAYLLRGRSRLALKEYPAARADFDEFVRRSGREAGRAYRASAEYWLGNSLAALEDLRAALADPSGCLELGILPSVLHLAAGSLVRQALHSPAQALPSFREALKALPPEASPELRERFLRNGALYGLAAAEPAPTVQRSLWEACKEVHGGCTRAAVGAFAESNSHPVTPDIPAGEPLFALHMASLQAERGAGDATLGWLQYLLQLNPEWDVRLANADPWIAGCRNEALLQWRTPRADFFREHSVKGNSVRVVNRSPYRLHSVRVQVRFSRLANNVLTPVEKELTADTLGAGQAQVWQGVFEGASLIGTNIQDVNLSLSCDEGWIRQG
jgi:tetratricopeptide (TPR) repeat protein